MGGDRFQDFQKKPESTLNDLMLKLRIVTTEAGADAYVQFKQGVISKKELIELIAKAI